MFDLKGVAAEKVAWAAGLFDGEGSTTASGDVGYPQVSVPQAGEGVTAPEVLLRFREIVGIGAINGPHVKHDGWRPMWKYTATNIGAIKVLELLWPHLGQVKRDQAVAVLERYRAHPTPRRDMAAATGRPLMHTCRRGHDLTDAYLHDGRRRCRECSRHRDRKYRAARKQS